MRAPPSPAAADTAPESAPAAHDHAHDHAVDVAAAQARVDTARAGRLHILEVQRLIRTMPKVVIAAVPGWAAGGGHSLNVVCDLSLASLEHARFKQTDADVGSFDAGYGSALLARQVGDKRARDLHLGGVGAGSSHEDAGRGRGDLGNGHVDGDAVSIPGQPGRSRQGPLEPGGEPRDGGVEVVVPEGGDLPPHPAPPCSRTPSRRAMPRKRVVILMSHTTARSMPSRSPEESWALRACRSNSPRTRSGESTTSFLPGTSLRITG